MTGNVSMISHRIQICGTDVGSHFKHRTCPTCRQPFFTISDEEVNAANAEASETSAIPSADVIAQIVHDQATMFLGQRVGGGAGAMAGLRVAREVVQRPEVNVSDNDDHEYERPAGMYS